MTAGAVEDYRHLVNHARKLWPQLNSAKSNADERFPGSISWFCCVRLWKCRLAGCSILADHPDISQSEARYIVRKAKRRHIEFSKNSMTEDMLTPDATPEIQMMRVVLGPDGTTGDMAYNSKEEEKCGIVLCGSMALEIDGQVYRLFTGDSFAFKAVSTIRFWAEGKESEIIWACTPALY